MLKTDSIEAALRTCKVAAWVSIVRPSIGLAAMILAGSLAGPVVLGIVFWYVLAATLFRASRVGAILAMAYFLADTALVLYALGPGAVTALLFTPVYVQAVRAAFAVRRFRQPSGCGHAFDRTMHAVCPYWPVPGLPAVGGEGWMAEGEPPLDRA